MKSFPFFSFLSLGGLGQENIRTYDLLVIGGGSAGLTAAKFSSTFGKSVAIIEKSRMGGDCTWTGCIPSKSLLASAKCAHAVSKSATFGVHLKGDVDIEMKVIKERIQKNIQHIYEEDDSPEALQKLGIDVINGSATFLAKKKLLVDGETLQAKDGILICTGATPIRPSIPGLQDVEYITYEEVFDLEEVPRTMTFVGGGPIACELAMAFSRLGSKVTVIASKLLPKEEPEANAAMSRVFESEGIVVTKSNLKSVEKVLNQNGHIAECENGARINGDLLLIAVGRKPTIEGMGLENIGIQLNERNGIQVDKNLQTSVKGVYAAGDCTGDRQL
jgi:pyruvate/2-oxoglutarate dehydrogenase complex dihydrolipoamide dehydrogenase (E3) component